MNKNIAETLGRFLKSQQPVLKLMGPVPDGLMPQPLPVQVCTNVMEGTDKDGKRTQWIALQVSTPQGVNFYLLDLNVAQELSDHIANAISNAKSGLVVVPVPQ